jgi:predicted RNA-binding Zn-ribbon protein involved in translation (DUF1610 family)
MSIYRKIWVENFGPIPKDNNGRSYEIHHIDGNHYNNEISNLKLVTIEEHYDIHLEQGNYVSALKMSKRMEMTPEEISEISKKANKERVDNKSHNWLGPTNNNKMLAEGRHPSQNPISIEKIRQSTLEMVANGTNSFCDREKQIERNKKAVAVMRRKAEMGIHNSQIAVKENRHNFQSPDASSQMVWTCKHCNKTGKNKTNYIRFHGDKCKEKKLLA